MSFKNTALATFASLVAPALGATHTTQNQDLLKLEINKPKSSATQALGDLGKALDDEFTGAKAPRDTGTLFAQFGGGAPINSRRYGGSFNSMQQFNMRLSPYGFGGLGSRFGGGATNGLGGNRFLRSRQQGPYNQQMYGNSGQQGQPPSQFNPNQNQSQPQSAITAQKNTPVKTELSFQKKILADKYLPYLNFKIDSSMSAEKRKSLEDDKPIIAGALAQTHFQFYKLPSSEQTLDEYGKLFKANSKAIDYRDEPSLGAITAYHGLSQKIQGTERKSIPEPDLVAKPPLDLPGTYNYNANTNLDSKTLAAKFSTELDSISFKTPLSPGVKERMSKALATTYKEYLKLPGDQQTVEKYHELVTVELKKQGFKPDKETNEFPADLLKNLSRANTNVANENVIPKIQAAPVFNGA